VKVTGTDEMMQSVYCHTDTILSCCLFVKGVDPYLSSQLNCFQGDGTYPDRALCAQKPLHAENKPGRETVVGRIVRGGNRDDSESTKNRVTGEARVA